MVERKLARWKRPKPKPANQASIFDQAEQAKHEGMEVSYRNAGTAWKRAAADRVRSLAKRRKYFTADDVIEWLDNNGIVTGENRALGAIMQSASRMGLIKHTNEFRRCRRPGRHGGTVAVWESMIYGKD